MDAVFKKGESFLNLMRTKSIRIKLQLDGTLAQVDLLLPWSQLATASAVVHSLSGSHDTLSFWFSWKLASHVQVYAPIPSTQF